jgi:hypothetical protein
MLQVCFRYQAEEDFMPARENRKKVPEVSIMRHSYQHHKPRAQIYPNQPQKGVCLRLLRGIRHRVESLSSHLARLKLQKMFRGR